MSQISTLAEIVATRERLRSEAIARLGLEKLREWMRSEDMEVLGCVYHTIGDRRYDSRIEPALSADERDLFLKRYFTRCFREDPKGQWCNSRYSAGWDLVGWLTALWKESKADPKSQSFLAGWKEWLRTLYLEGDEPLRECLTNATLEHLFETGGIAKYFSDWKDEVPLSEAYVRAMDWSKRGGRSPLGGSRRSAG